MKMRNYRKNLTGEKREKFLKQERLRQARIRDRNKLDADNVRENNRLRQQKCRAYKSIPKSPSKFRKVVEAVCKASKSSPTKQKILSDCLATFKLTFESIPMSKPPKLSVLQLQMFRRQNRKTEHAQLVEKMKRDFGSLNKASISLQVPYKTLHNLCQPLQKKVKRIRETWVNIREFYARDTVSHEHPSIRQKGRRFLTQTVEECHLMYKEYCRMQEKQPVSLRTFGRLRPKNVFKINQTPDRQCICDECENFRLVRRALNRIGVRGVPSHSQECIEMSLCDIDDSDANCDADCDGFHQINPRYGRIECINRSCKACGKNLVMMKILRENPDIESNVKMYEYEQWVWVRKTPKTRKLENQKIMGTVLDIVTLFAEQLDGLVYHIFSCNWNYAQFQHIRDNLKPGFLLQVYDFGQNFMNVYQDEPQQVHWDHTQTTIHPIISYYIKPGESTITTEEHIMISDDGNHDKYAVRKFQQMSLQHLRSKGIVPRYIVIFSDNCGRQYKGKGTFQFHSESGTPLLHMYFGARHGKGPADGAVGRVKHTAWRAIKSRQVVIRNALEFFHFCESTSHKKEGSFIQKFFYVAETDIESDRESIPIVADTSPGSNKWFSVRSTGTNLFLEVRQVGCCCESCLLGDGSACPNQAYASQWSVYNLVTGKPLMDPSFKNNHWGKNIRSNSDANSNDSHADSHARKSLQCKNPGMKTQHAETTEITGQWSEILDILNSFRTYNQLERYVFSLNEDYTNSMKCTIQRFRKCRHHVDFVAKMSLHVDAPENVLPVLTIGDGNCCPRSLSIAAFGDDSRHIEMRAKIVVESVLHKERYLSHEYLAQGASAVREDVTFPEVYAMFSGQNAAGLSENIIETVYEQEIMGLTRNGSYMGIWQLFAAANVLGHPVRSVFPLRGSESFRRDFNRMCLPADGRQKKTKSITLMWTPTVENGPVHHFVPLLPQ